jgi:hypothetical protein
MNGNSYKRNSIILEVVSKGFMITMGLVMLWRIIATY